MSHGTAEDQTTEPVDTSDMQVAISRGGAEEFVEGRRSYIQYRDLGVRDGSRGRFGGTIARGTGAPIEPTGWHYHVCEAQLTYILRGWVEIQFGDGTSTRVEAGDSVFIPGGVRHAETAAAPDIEVIEYTIPAQFETVPCDGPGPAAAIPLAPSAVR